MAGKLTVAAREQMTSTDWCLQSDAAGIECPSGGDLGALVQRIVEATGAAESEPPPLLSGARVERISRLSRMSPVCDEETGPAMHGDAVGGGSGWVVEGELAAVGGGSGPLSQVGPSRRMRLRCR
jgi:hypothetical protein